MTSPAQQEREGVTRRAILDAARRLFGEVGYGRTSIRQLAAAAGVAPRDPVGNF